MATKLPISDDICKVRTAFASVLPSCRSSSSWLKDSRTSPEGIPNAMLMQFLRGLWAVVVAVCLNYSASLSPFPDYYL